MVHNSLPAAVANALPAPTNSTAKVTDKSAAANGQFKSIYLSLPILEVPAVDAPGSKPANIPSPASNKKTPRTDAASAIASIPAPVVPSPVQAARALTVTLSSSQAEGEASPKTALETASLRTTVQPGRPEEANSQSRETEIPARSLDQQSPATQAVPGSVSNRDSNNVPPEEADSNKAPRANSATVSPGVSELHAYQNALAEPTPSAQAVEESRRDTNPRQAKSQTQGQEQVQATVSQPAPLPLQSSATQPGSNPPPTPGQRIPNAKTDPGSAYSVAKTLSDSKSEQLAFSLHLDDPGSSTVREPGKPQQTTDTPADVREAKRPEAPAASSLGPNAPRDASEAGLHTEFSNTGIILPSSDASAAPRLEMRPATWITQLAETSHVPAATLVHEAHAILPDSPKVNMNGEILLHLQGNDQSSAAVRLVDRAGAVNVSVHASDAELRNTLRSNVGELVSQLNGQGWKAEVDKAGTAPVRAQTAQDPRSDGQRSSSQHQSPSDGQRQPQRDRRSSSGQWLNELAQQTSSPSGNPGGKS